MKHILYEHFIYRDELYRGMTQYRHTEIHVDTIIYNDALCKEINMEIHNSSKPNFIDTKILVSVSYRKTNFRDTRYRDTAYIGMQCYQQVVNCPNF